jgi:hypothetical protein
MVYFITPYPIIENLENNMVFSADFSNFKGF